MIPRISYFYCPKNKIGPEKFYPWLPRKNPGLEYIEKWINQRIFRAYPHNLSFSPLLLLRNFFFTKIILKILSNLTFKKSKNYG